MWAWFPRQITIQEFRIGALEYELINRETYCADWKDVRLTCDTWMLMPELQEFLGMNSRIVAFQKLFQINHIDREATWYKEWIYPGHDVVDDKLPEKTLLQRRLKEYLLEGKSLVLQGAYEIGLVMLSSWFGG